MAWADEKQPIYDENNDNWTNFGLGTAICLGEFEAIFGFVLKPGQCVKVKFSAKLVE